MRYPALFEARFTAWAVTLRPDAPDLIALDGSKALSMLTPDRPVALVLIEAEDDKAGRDVDLWRDVRLGNFTDERADGRQ